MSRFLKRERSTRMYPRESVPAAYGLAAADGGGGDGSYTTPDNGKRFVGTVFALRGVSGRFSDDANNDGVLIGSDGQTCQPDFSSIAGFRKTSIQRDPNGGFCDNPPATWAPGR
jgi:hypothetical protein